MGKKKCKTARPGKGDIPQPLMVVGAVKCSPTQKNARQCQSYEATKKDLRSKTMISDTLEGSGSRVLKICVDLCPVLASAKEEPMREEARPTCQDELSGPDEGRATSVEKLQRNHQKRTCQSPVTDRALVPLPPIEKQSLKQSSSTHSDRLCTAVSHPSLPPISLSQQGVLGNSAKTLCEMTTAFPRIQLQRTGPLTTPLMDNTTFTRCRSPQFPLHDISVSSIEALLQRVTERLGRKERSSESETWRLAGSSDHLMSGTLRCLREKRNLHRTDCKTEYEVISSEVKQKITMTTDQGWKDSTSLYNGSKLPILTMAKRTDTSRPPQ